VYTTTATPAKETPPGTIKNCGHYYDTVSGDYCQMIAMNFSITFDQLRDMNPQLNSDCLNLWANASYCVATVRGSTLTPVSIRDAPGNVGRQRQKLTLVAPDHSLAHIGFAFIHIRQPVAHINRASDIGTTSANSIWRIDRVLSMVHRCRRGLLLSRLHKVWHYVRSVEGLEY
jgi:hypothetical protein